MRLNNRVEVTAFEEAVRKCQGNVWLASREGRFNLKSFMSRYVAIGKLIAERGSELELFCDEKVDEANFFSFFQENPNVLSL